MDILNNVYFPHHRTEDLDRYQVALSLAVAYLLPLAKHLLGVSLELVIAAATAAGKVSSWTAWTQLSMPA